MSMHEGIVGRVLVAGGAGFVGTNLVGRLLCAGFTVDCIDNLITGREENLDQFEDNENFSFIAGDICDIAFVRRLARRRYGTVFNLACPTGVPNIALLGEEMLLTSSVGNHNLLKLAQRWNARFLFASTAEAYGDPQVFPQAETYSGNVDPVGPRSPYEEGKRFGEAMTVFYARQLGVDARIVRIFNTYGRAMSPEDARVIPTMLRHMMQDHSVPIYGDGKQTRTFLHVNDLIDGFYTVMAWGNAGEVYNVGGDRERTIAELYAIARQVTGSASPMQFEPHFIPDHHRRQPDTRKVRALGWAPSISLEAGLADAYAHMLNLFVPSRSRRRIRGEIARNVRSAALA